MTPSSEEQEDGNPSSREREDVTLSLSSGEQEDRIFLRGIGGRDSVLRGTRGRESFLQGTGGRDSVLRGTRDNWTETDETFGSAARCPASNPIVLVAGPNTRLFTYGLINQPIETPTLPSVRASFSDMVRKRMGNEIGEGVKMKFEGS